MAAAEIRIKSIKDLDGLSIRDAKRMPHPIELARWSAAKLYTIDVDLGVFRLTDSGRSQIAIKSVEAA